MVVVRFTDSDDVWIGAGCVRRLLLKPCKEGLDLILSYCSSYMRQYCNRVDIHFSGSFGPHRAAGVRRRKRTLGYKDWVPLLLQKTALPEQQLRLRSNIDLLEDQNINLVGNAASGLGIFCSDSGGHHSTRVILERFLKPASSCEANP